MCVCLWKTCFVSQPEKCLDISENAYVKITFLFLNLWDLYSVDPLGFAKFSSHLELFKFEHAALPPFTQ